MIEVLVAQIVLNLQFCLKLLSLVIKLGLLSLYLT